MQNYKKILIYTTLISIITPTARILNTAKKILIPNLYHTLKQPVPKKNATFTLTICKVINNLIILLLQKDYFLTLQVHE